MIRIILFAGLRDRIGRAELEAPFQSIDISSLLTWVESQYPAVTFDHVMVAINEQWSNKQSVAKQGDTVALLPPVSGG